MSRSGILANPPWQIASRWVRWLAAGLVASTVALACLLYVRSAGEGQVAASFLGYDLLDNGSEQLALIRLTNSSSRSFYYFTAGAIASNGVPVVMCLYRVDSGGVAKEWSEGTSPPRMTSFSLSPGSSDVVAARISSKDKASQIGVHCLEQRTDWPEPLQTLRRLWWKVVPPKSSSVRAWVSVTKPTSIADPIASPKSK